MANKVAHFAIHADDLERARRFYGSVFGWSFQSWGPPNADFCLIKTETGEDPGVKGAMQHRRYNVAPKELIGYECSIAVADVDATAAAIEAHGGKVVMPKCAIPGVGWLIKFLDTEGNLACAVRFDEHAK